MSQPGETFLRALAELSEARAKGDTLGVRQAAEKAWLAVVEATDWYLENEHGIKVVQDDQAHRVRREYLRMYDRSDLEETYIVLSQRLHGDIFYMGAEVRSADVRRYFQTVAGYVEETTGYGGLVDAVAREFV